jgi:uncharacterized sulfatase
MSRLLAQWILLAIGSCLPGLGAERPHLVVFLSDDHTWRDSSRYGSTDIPTPNLDRVAATGMTFDRAYVASPSCAPSRATLLTGLWPARHGAEANHARPRPEIRKLPAYLQALGYEVVSFGKVGHYRQTAEYGFDLARHFHYHEDIAIPEAVKWLRGRKSEKPLCLFVGTNWPHVPWPESAAGGETATPGVPPHHVDHAATRAWRARYAAAVCAFDAELGLVFDTARAVLGDDLFFLHTSDHGAQWPFGKWTLYEDGVRTPLVVSWPGRVPAGRRSPALVSWVDLLPTLLEVAGGQLPADLDGRSFLPVLEGRSDRHRDHVFFTHTGDGDFNVFPMRGVVDASGHKLIRNLHPAFRFHSHITAHTGDSGYWDPWLDQAVSDPAARARVQAYHRRPPQEIYDTERDPWERQNLDGDPAHAATRERLTRALDAWLAETRDTQAVMGTPTRAAVGVKPNLILVVADDLGWADLSCFGNREIQTEALDRLAGEGLRFTRFYVNAPICSPSRTAFLTGQYPQRWRMNSYLDNRQRNHTRGVAPWLNPAAPSLARALREAGYATGHFGKWHLGGQRDVNHAPAIARYGFDRSLTNFEGLGPKLLPLVQGPDDRTPRKIWADAESLGGPVAWTPRSEITGGFVREAIRFIDRAGATGQPFFLNLWPDDPHSPWFPAGARAPASPRARYLAVVDEMDAQLAPLFDRVRDDPRLRDNTLILFCSDNGPEAAVRGPTPLRTGKTWLFEGGIRSPLLVWGPGLLARDALGTANEEAVLSALDLNRSLYALTGTPVPAGVALDGEDRLDTLLGRSRAGRQAPLFFRRPPDRPGFGQGFPDLDNPDLAAIEGKWKYLVNLDGGDPQLYALDTDPGETRNLAADHPDVVARLHAAVMAWNAELPRDAGDPAFVPGPPPAAGQPKR